MEAPRNADRKFLAALLVLALAVPTVFGVGYFFGMNSVVVHYRSLKANVFYVYELFGQDAEWQQGNLITDIGENMTLFSLFNNNYTLSKLAVGNCSVDQTDSALDAVYDDPDDGQYIAGTLSGYWLKDSDISKNITYKWTFAETVNLNASGWYASDDTYAFALANFNGGAQTFNNGENLTVTWALTNNAN